MEQLRTLSIYKALTTNISISMICLILKRFANIEIKVLKRLPVSRDQITLWFNRQHPFAYDVAIIYMSRIFDYLADHKISIKNKQINLSKNITKCEIFSQHCMFIFTRDYEYYGVGFRSINYVVNSPKTFTFSLLHIFLI